MASIKKRTSVVWWGLGALLLVLSLLGVVGDASAATETNNSLDAITQLYKSNAGKWESVLRGYALKLFWLLAFIEFAWAAIMMALKGADFGEWVAGVVNQILFIGFFYTLLLHSSEWAGAIVNSFKSAGSSASGSAGGMGGISPSNVFDVGLQLANKVMDKASFWAPGDSLGLMLSALIIIVCFALIAAFLILALVESYVVISAGVLLMGFGGSRWTKDYAVKVMVYAMSVGAKLFILQLLIGLGETMIQGWVQGFETKNTDIFIMVGSSIVMLALVRIIPDMVQGLINGTSFASGGALTGAAAAVGGAAVGVAAGMAGASMAVNAAGKLASAQVAAQTAAGAGPTSQMGRFASLTGNTLKNLGSSAAQDVGKRLSGRPAHGTIGGRMSESMNMQRREHQADLQKPTPPRDAPTPSAGENSIRPE
jgi:type IV secretion system protein TrbL